MTTEIIVPNFITVLFALLGGLARVAVEFLSFLRVYLSICEAIHHNVDILHAGISGKYNENAHSRLRHTYDLQRNNREAAAVFFPRLLRVFSLRFSALNL
jgi:hypothetical protein